MKFIQWLISLFKSPQATQVTPAPTVAPTDTKILKDVLVKQPQVSNATNQPAPNTIAPVTPNNLFDTPQNARHSVRVICDTELPLTHSVIINGKGYLPKDVICACIEQESGFINYKADGIPLKQENIDAKTGKLDSTDWGICQINDTPTWHIGPGLAFSSVDDVMQHPDKAVRYMIDMFKAGELSQWVSYSSGAYEKYLPQ